MDREKNARSTREHGHPIPQCLLAAILLLHPTLPTRKENANPVPPAHRTEKSKPRPFETPKGSATRKSSSDGQRAVVVLSGGAHSPGEKRRKSGPPVHHIGKQHLHRYLSEFDFRYNSRNLKDGTRALLAIKGADGNRLMLRDSFNKTAENN